MRKALILSACLGLALTACADGPSSGDGSDDAAAAVRDAVERTLDAGSARIAFSVEVEADGRTQAVDGTAELVFGDGDPQDVEAHLTIEYPATGSGMPGGALELIVDRGPVLYLNADVLAAVFPVDTPWIALDPSAMGGGWKDLGGLGSAPTDPSSTLDLLGGAVDVELVGEDEIDGEAATHYRATIDPEAALEHVPAAQRAAVQEAVRKLRGQAGGEVPSFPVDLWIADGLLARVSFAVSGDELGADDGGSMSATLTLSDVGASFAIDPPPADQVTDLSKLAGAWGAAAAPTAAA